MTLEEFRSRRADQKRAAIVAAATRLFAERGFDRVSMATLAEEAGVSTATVYRHYEDKADLFGAVLDALVEEFLPRRREPGPPGDDPPLTELCLRYGRLLSTPRVVGLVRAVVANSEATEGFRLRLAKHGKAIFAGEFGREIRRLARDGGLEKGIDVERARSELQGMIEHYTLVRGLLFGQRPGPRKLREVVEGCLETWHARWAEH